MKAKTKNILTTIFGVLIALGDVALWIMSRTGMIEYDIKLMEILVLAALAATLIRAYNKTLEAFANKFLGLKKD